MEKNRDTSDSSDGKPSGKKGIDSYFTAYSPEVPPSPPPVEPRRVSHIPREGILLFDRHQELTTDKKPAAKEKSKETTSEEDESDDKPTVIAKKEMPKKAAKTFRPVIPRASILEMPQVEAADEQKIQSEDRVASAQASQELPERLAEHSEDQLLTAHEQAIHDAFGELPAIEGPHDVIDVASEDAADQTHHTTRPAPLFSSVGSSGQTHNYPEVFVPHPRQAGENAMSGDLFERPADIPAENPLIAPLPVAEQHISPTPGSQQETASQWPHYAYYQGQANQPPQANMSPPAPRPAGYNGNYNQPPLPPRPPSGAAMGNTAGGQPPLNPNVYPSSFGGGNPNNASPNYNMAPANLSLPPANVLRTTNADPLARLMGIGNWLGNRKTRKKLGNRIDQLQKDTQKGATELQNQQRQFAERQRKQTLEMQQMRANQERFTAPRPFSERPTLTEAVQKTEAGRQNPSEFRTMPASAPEQHMQEQTESPDLQPREHVERSSWHNIVVNDRGQEVTGAIQYGEGFRRERQQEIIRDRTSDAVAASAAAGAVGVMGAQQDHTMPSYGDGSNTLPSGMVSTGLQAGSPTHVDPQHQLSAHEQKSSAVPGPVFWIMLVIIVAAFFAAALI